MAAPVGASFPQPDYEDGIRRCRQYRPEETTVARAALDAPRGPAAPLDDLGRLVRRRVMRRICREGYIETGGATARAPPGCVTFTLRIHYRE